MSLPPKMKLKELRRILAEELRLERRTGHRVTPDYLVSAIRQRGHLHEADEEIPVDQEESGDSLDRQVDRYLAEYESGAKTGSEPAEQMEWRQLVRSMVMAEAPEDEEGGAEGDPEVGGGEQPAEEPGVPAGPPKLGLNDIDVEMFANDVARLIENYDSLLEVRRTLVRRSVNFIAENYDAEVVKELRYALRDDHGLLADETKREYEADAFEAPFAGEAGPGGGV